MGPYVRAVEGIASWLVVAWSVFIGVVALSLAGARYFGEWHDALHTLGILSCGLIAVLSAFWGMRDRRRAALWCLAAGVPTFMAWLADASRYSLGSDVALAAIAVSVSLLVPGLFWLVTYKFGWPEILQRGFSGWPRQVAVCAAAFVIAAFTVFGSLDWALRMPRSAPERCASTSVVSSALSSNHAMFLAHPLFSHPSPTVTRSYYPPWWPLWTLAVVDRAYWGLPWWNHKIVAVGYLSAQSQFLFDGERDNGLISSLVPLYFSRPCGQTSGIDGAEAQLRVLSEGPPKSGVRIIGSVYGRNSSEDVVITGPSGVIHATTDRFGVFDEKGLPGGRYGIALASSDNPDHKPSIDCGGSEGMPLVEGQVWGCRPRKYN